MKHSIIAMALLAAAVAWPATAQADNFSISFGYSSGGYYSHPGSVAYHYYDGFRYKPYYKRYHRPSTSVHHYYYSPYVQHRKVVVERSYTYPCYDRSVTYYESYPYSRHSYYSHRPYEYSRSRGNINIIYYGDKYRDDREKRYKYGYDRYGHYDKLPGRKNSYDYRYDRYDRYDDDRYDRRDARYRIDDDDRYHYSWEDRDDDRYDRDRYVDRDEDKSYQYKSHVTRSNSSSLRSSSGLDRIRSNSSNSSLNRVRSDSSLSRIGSSPSRVGGVSRGRSGSGIDSRF